MGALKANKDSLILALYDLHLQLADEFHSHDIDARFYFKWRLLESNPDVPKIWRLSKIHHTRDKYIWLLLKFVWAQTISISGEDFPKLTQKQVWEIQYCYSSQRYLCPSPKLIWNQPTKYRESKKKRNWNCYTS